MGDAEYPGAKVSARATLSQMLKQRQENILDKSAELFRRAVSLSPKDWRANRNLGMVYRRMGNDEFADKFLSKAASLRKRSEAGDPTPR